MPKLTINTITSGYAPVATLNANFAAIVTALENTLSRDGTSPNAMSADLDMDSNRILNLPAPTNAAEPARHGDIQTYVDEAEGFATNAEASAVAAAASASAASASATTAASSASSASTFATNASNSADAAAASELAAETAADKIPDPLVADALKVLRVNVGGTAYELITPSSGGDVNGPASAVDGGFVLFDGTTGKIIKDSGVTGTTGTGSVVRATSPTLVTPLLGTPTSGTLTNCTGLPIGSGISGLGTDVATALAVAIGSAGAPVVNGGVLGTPSSGTLTNATGLPIGAGTTGTLAVDRGGTGQTSYTNGQLLIGNTTGNTLTKATLTASTGISVTNGAGSITITNSGVTSYNGATGAVSGMSTDVGNLGVGMIAHGYTTSGSVGAGGTTSSFNITMARDNGGAIQLDSWAPGGTWRNIGNRTSTFTASNDWSGSVWQRIS